jgi:beta-lactamase superfamily II metal-dependent hydrolase
MSEHGAIQMVAYKTIAGQSYPIGSIGKSDLRLRVINTTEDECREYAATLEAMGYCRRSAREIPAGSANAYNVNLYYAYENEDSSVSVFWDASMRTVFITAEEKRAVPAAKVGKSESPSVVAPTFTQMQLHDGMCYILQLATGEYILVDGGAKKQEAEERLYTLLKENTPFDKPKVALWIFTHSDDDHIGLATEFLRKYKDEVDIEAFSYQFIDCDKVQVAMGDMPRMKAEIQAFEDAVSGSYPNAVVYGLHTGQGYHYEGVDIEVLYSLDDTFPFPYVSFNDVSAALRMKFASGKTILLLADCMTAACRDIADRYGDYLKSDILQVSHHGLIGGYKRLYQIVDPEICFWPTSERKFLGLKAGQRYQWCLGEGGCDYNAYLRDDSIRKRTHYTNGSTTTIKV